LIGSHSPGSTAGHEKEVGYKKKGGGGEEKDGLEMKALC